MQSRYFVAFIFRVPLNEVTFSPPVEDSISLDLYRQDTKLDEVEARIQKHIEKKMGGAAIGAVVRVTAFNKITDL